MSTATNTISRPPWLEVSAQRWLALSLVCSTLYFVTKPWQPFPGSVVLKGLCIAPLAVLAWQVLPKPANRWLGAALACSTLGDVLLDLRGLFVQGLGAFLLAHLLYAGLFWRNWRRPVQISSSQTITLAALALFSLSLTLWLWTGLGKLAVPVLCYIGAITLMVATAVTARFRQSWIVWGAFLFLLSDALIGINKFKMPVPLRDYLVWSTYYLGQCGIALGFLREKLEHDRL